jgi:hypothetical protein
MPESAVPAYITALIRHFEDLRDGTHGGSSSRKDKEAHFEKQCNCWLPWPPMCPRTQPQQKLHNRCRKSKGEQVRKQPSLPSSP